MDKKGDDEERRAQSNQAFNFTMMTLHINNQYAKKRGIEKHLLLANRIVMHQEQVDMVAGDFYGAAWRRRSGNEQRRDSTFEEASLSPGCQFHVALQHCGGPCGVLREWPDVCGVIKPTGSETEWRIRMHGAFDIPHETLGIKNIDKSCLHEIWIHLLHVNARLVDRASRDGQYRRSFVGKRNSPHDHWAFLAQSKEHQVPLIQQLQRLLVKLGPLESKSRVPRQSLNSQRVLVELGILGPEQMATVPPLQQP